MSTASLNVNQNADDAFIKSKSVSPVDSSDIKLSPEYSEIAKQNFGETDDIRRRSIDLMREWAVKNPRFEKTRLDSTFLLLFLRSRKFSLPMAQELMERALIVREHEFQGQKHFKMVTDEDEQIIELLNRGLTFVLPKVDKSNNYCFFVKISAVDSSKYNTLDIMKCAFLAINSYLGYPEFQINKVKIYIDFQGFSPFHLKYLPSFMSYFKTLLSAEKLISGFCQSIHILNLNTALRWVVKQVTTILSEKIRNRLFLHENSRILLDTNDEDNLPIEYGGTLEMKNLIETHKEKLKYQRKYIKFMNDIKLNMHLYPKCVRNFEFKSLKKTIEEIVNEEQQKKMKKFESTNSKGSFKNLSID